MCDNPGISAGLGGSKIMSANGRHWRTLIPIRERTVGGATEATRAHQSVGPREEEALRLDAAEAEGGGNHPAAFCQEFKLRQTGPSPILPRQAGEGLQPVPQGGPLQWSDPRRGGRSRWRGRDTPAHDSTPATRRSAASIPAARHQPAPISTVAPSSRATSETSSAAQFLCRLMPPPLRVCPGGRLAKRLAPRHPLGCRLAKRLAPPRRLRAAHRLR